MACYSWAGDDIKVYIYVKQVRALRIAYFKISDLVLERIA